MNKPVITNVYVWDNNMVMVFDQYGQQMPEYQGPKEEVLPLILRDAPHVEPFHGAWRDYREKFTR